MVLLKENYMNELISAGFDLVQVREYDVTDYYSRSEDLIFLLKHTLLFLDSRTGRGFYYFTKVH